MPSSGPVALAPSPLLALIPLLIGVYHLVRARLHHA
jgi:hypothetical protein